MMTYDVYEAFIEHDRRTDAHETETMDLLDAGDMPEADIIPEDDEYFERVWGPFEEREVQVANWGGACFDDADYWRQTA